MHLCEGCVVGPAGEHGHPALLEVFRSGRTAEGGPEFVSYCCRQCGDVWSRRAHGGDAYTWRRTESGNSPKAASA